MLQMSVENYVSRSRETAYVPCIFYIFFHLAQVCIIMMIILIIDNYTEVVRSVFLMVHHEIIVLLLSYLDMFVMEICLGFKVFRIIFCKKEERKKSCFYILSLRVRQHLEICTPNKNLPKKEKHAQICDGLQKQHEKNFYGDMFHSA